MARPMTTGGSHFRRAAVARLAGHLGSVLVAGIVLALAVSCAFVLQRTVEQTFMPIALVLRSVPLIAMAPLITLVFGRDIMAVTVIGAIVCFFPALVNIMYGLRASPRSAVDL